MTITTDLSKFGYREYAELRRILDAMIDKGLPNDFYDDGVIPMFNMNSGFVFLTNNEYQVAMMNGDKLESFYSCPQCGHESFKDEIQHNPDNEDCQEWIKDTLSN
jgi:hypothetical protein